MIGTRGRGLALGVAVLTLAAVGCGCFTRFNARVAYPASSLESGQRRASIEVHLVGVPESAYRLWYELDITDYFQKPEQDRPPARKKILFFGEKRPAEQVLSRDEPIWNQWRQENVAYLFILAHLPGDWKPKPGAADPRRIILYLNSDYWPEYYWGRKDFPVRITGGGLSEHYPGATRKGAMPQ